VRFVVLTATTVKISVFGKWSHVIWLKCTDDSEGLAALINMVHDDDDDDDRDSVIL
jgi:hypothetical protein